MPASIAHMLIADAAFDRVSVELPAADFVDMLRSHAEYLRLGALGPDLPYYSSAVSGALDLLFDRSDKPMGVDQWSYQLHSKDPNRFPLKLLEVIWRDAGSDWDKEDQANFAFTCGFLTHVAADQIIHPFVNCLAGPYYKLGANREKHRRIEVLQDVRLYANLRDGDLLAARPNDWCDPNPGWGKNTEPWFRYLIQKAFIESHAVCPSEDDIESWVDGILLVLRAIHSFGPYVKATNAVKTGDNEAKTWFDDLDYMNRCFRPAVDLSVIYLRAAQKFYALGNDWDDRCRHEFLTVVQNADLSAPMETNILKAASDAMAAWDNHQAKQA